MIDLSIINKVRYYPELIPSGDFWSLIPLGTFATPSPIDVRRLDPWVIELTNINVDPFGGLELRIRSDKDEHIISSSQMTNTTVYRLKFTAKEYLRYMVYNNTNNASNWNTSYGLWVYKPSIAQKIMLGMVLTPNEEEISKKFNLKYLVDSGIYPLSRSYQIEREYHQLLSTGETIYTKTVDVPLSPSSETLLQVYPAQGLFAVLKGFTCSNTDPTNYVTLTINRDGDIGYITFPAPAMANITEMECFIPAMSELRVTTSAVSLAASNVSFVFRVGFYKLTDILKARWKLPGSESLPEEVINKSMAGIL